MTSVDRPGIPGDLSENGDSPAPSGVGPAADGGQELSARERIEQARQSPRPQQNQNQALLENPSFVAAGLGSFVGGIGGWLLVGGVPGALVGSATGVGVGVGALMLREAQ